MKLRIAVVVLVAALAPGARADQAVQNVQQALKDQGFYYGEVTGEKNADTTAAIRRYQIRNGLQISGDLNDETLKSLGVDSSGARAIGKASPTPAPAAPETSDLRAQPRESSAPTNPLTGQPFPEPQQDRSADERIRGGEQGPVRPAYDAVPANPSLPDGSCQRIDIRALTCFLIKVHRLELGKDRADENLCFNAQRNSVCIVRDPNSRAPEFPMWLQFKLLAQVLELKIDLDRVVGARPDGHVFAAENGYSCQISGGGWINDNAINAVIA